MCCALGVCTVFEGWDVSAERRVERAVVSAIFPAKSVDFRKFLAALRALRFPAAFPEILTQPNVLRSILYCTLPGLRSC